LVRARYFFGMLLEKEDLQVEQVFGLALDRAHNAALHGQGTICGLKVDDGACAWEILVEPGRAIDCLGRLIVVPELVTLDVQAFAEQAFREHVHQYNRGWSKDTSGSQRDPEDRGYWPKEIELWVSLCYWERPERPVQALGSPGNCDAPACEHSRVRHGYCITVSTEKPERPPSLLDDLDCIEGNIRERLCHWIIERCRMCKPDPCGKEHHCVTLASVKVRPTGEVRQPDNHSCRDIVFPTSVLAELVLTHHEEWKS